MHYHLYKGNPKCYFQRHLMFIAKIKFKKVNFQKKRYEIKHFNIKHINDKITFKLKRGEFLIDGSKKKSFNNAYPYPFFLSQEFGIATANATHTAIKANRNMTTRRRSLGNSSKVLSKLKRKRFLKVTGYQFPEVQPTRKT